MSDTEQVVYGCGNCVLWQETDPAMKPRRGRCRAYPPTVVPDASGDPKTAWPMTSPSDWCRECSGA